MQNNIYSNFKPYSHFVADDNLKKDKHDVFNKIKPVIGASLGVACALGISKYAYKHDFFKEVPQKVLDNSKSKLLNTKKEVASMLTMAALSNLGAVLMTSSDSNKEQKKKKWHEAGFQIMNTSIPMLMVTGVNILCDNVKKLNNKPAKILSSAAAMISGAVLATKITNATKKDNEPKRKYTIKDSIANFDDVVATIVVGFPQLSKLNQVAKVALPFIYTYSGSRAGAKK